MKASWTAVRDADVTALLDRLDWVEMGESASGSSETELVIMPSGWSVIVQIAYAEPPPIASIADLGSDVLTGFCTSVAMGGELHGKGWDIDYDCSREDELRVTGEPPAAFAEALKHATAKQARGEERVDYIWSVPLEVSQAICGFHPEDVLPEGAVTIALEPRLKGAAGRLQAERQVVWRALTMRVKGELAPKVEALGFTPMTTHPDRSPSDTETNGYMRRRGDRVDRLIVGWGMDRVQPQITLSFVASDVVNLRAARMGEAETTLVKGPGLVSRLFGARALPTDMDDDIGRAVTEAGLLLQAVDAYLVNETPHPSLKPPSYYGPAN